MAKDEKNKKNKNPKKSFLKESKAELKKVSWPTPKSLANDTATVIGIVLVVAIIVFILDFIFLAFNENVLIKAEEKIKGNNTVIEQTVNQSSDENTESNTTTDETNTEDSNVTEETTTQENTENSGTGNNSAE
ncbi:MAG TPA: preprotein translocase subunit SecE [Clostridiaceae bacterium]|jgi:preprotein translocase subunit SecE|nr:preprotein translocase subunit SecE [Clostridiaceae bacterium]